MLERSALPFRSRLVREALREMVPPEVRPVDEIINEDIGDYYARSKREKSAQRVDSSPNPKPKVA